MVTRTLSQLIASRPTTDGGGVKLRRSIGQTQNHRLDPFLMLDEFSSQNANDYIAGFPDHPHRGFETVTYMLDGHMRHADNLGNTGDLISGAAQWMTAGRGIIHSEMPQQLQGSMRGFQCWINLPANEKMKPAAYQDIPPEQIPLLTLANGGQVKIIAGTTTIEEQLLSGPIQGLTTEALFLDVNLPADTEFKLGINDSHQAFVYPFEGELSIVADGAPRLVPSQHVGVLTNGDVIQIKAGEQGVRFLLLSGRPLAEPIAQYGPFVMNTQEEIEQAIADYRNGVLV